MSRGINKAIIVGTLGKDPDVRFMPSGGAVASFSIATNEEWKDKQTGEKQSKAEWHNITAFGKLAEICGEYLKKGQQVYVEGRIQTDKYEKNGVDHYSTKIIINNMQMLGSGGGTGRSADSGSQAPADGGQSSSQPAPNSCGDFSDDIPFASLGPEYIA